MNQSLISVVVFVALLALLPWAVKWVQRRQSGVGGVQQTASRLISVLAVGPHQRVVTVEVGPADARTWLVLGVTPQTITTLHTTAPGATAPSPSQSLILPATGSPD